MLRALLIAGACTVLVLAGGCRGREQTAGSLTPPPEKVATGSEPTPTTSSPDDPVVLIFGDGDPDIGPAPLTVQFSVSDPFMELMNPVYEWDFGDGSPASDQRSPKHVYERPGKYTARVRVTEFGDEDEDTVDIVVEEPEEPVFGEGVGPEQ